jgi:hypothetical protein
VQSAFHQQAGKGKQRDIKQFKRGISIAGLKHAIDTTTCPSRAVRACVRLVPIDHAASAGHHVRKSMFEKQHVFFILLVVSCIHRFRVKSHWKRIQKKPDESCNKSTLVRFQNKSYWVFPANIPPCGKTQIQPISLQLFDMVPSMNVFLARAVQVTDTPTHRTKSPSCF